MKILQLRKYRMAIPNIAPETTNTPTPCHASLYRSSSLGHTRAILNVSRNKVWKNGARLPNRSPRLMYRVVAPGFSSSYVAVHHERSKTLTPCAHRRMAKQNKKYTSQAGNTSHSSYPHEGQNGDYIPCRGQSCDL